MSVYRFFVLNLTGALIFFGGAACPRLARAEVDSPSAARSAVSGPPLVMSPAQLEVFAKLVGEPVAEVAQRLSMNPSIVPFAVVAAEVRRERRGSGKVLTIVGFGILGVGTAAGVTVFLSSLTANCTNDGCTGSDGRFRLGLLIVALSQGVGLALGIPGIVRMASQSDAENEAAARYHATTVKLTTVSSTLPPESAQIRTPESRLPAAGFLVPLLSAVF